MPGLRACAARRAPGSASDRRRPACPAANYVLVVLPAPAAPRLTIAWIAKFPTAARVVRGATRALHMRAHLPYTVLYVVHEHLDLIDLTIFMHDRQDQHGLIPRLG